MKLDEEKSAGRDKDEAALELLRQLKQKLRTGDISRARRAAYNLSWLQEDGLGILTETLVGNFSRTAKIASTYGLRSMRGRMKKMALAALEEGLNHRDQTTKAVCVQALAVLKGGAEEEGGPRERRKRGRPRIRGIRGRGKRNTEWNRASSRR
ncbi:MAG: hypothetical protein JSV99_05175 [Planctomycetota bacterium]|nr:MAG: hypothetical protein JSV99_05175 [Planctomycetota bacterium]